MALVLQPRFNDDGLIPAIAQDASDGRVLMLAWMDAEALRRTLATRRATYWSRSRREYWVKGQTSGHTQTVREVRLDCDGDVLLLEVDQVGPACHTGAPTCFQAYPPLFPSPEELAEATYPAVASVPGGAAGTDEWDDTNDPDLDPPEPRHAR
jgi:phosphoribosyl-AMP cyclohydrolase